MQFTSSAHEDIQRYYLHTYVKFAETGDELWYIRSATPHVVEAKNWQGDIVKLNLDDNHPYEVNYVLPHKSFFQYKDWAALLYRIPAQQYQRGISSGNTAIGFPSSDGNIPDVPVGFEALRAYVSKQHFFSLEEARVSKNISCALSPRMAMEVKTGIIFIDFTRIAKLVGNVVIPEKEIFRPELEELVKGSTCVVKPREIRQPKPLPYPPEVVRKKVYKNKVAL
jgi:hypothetical protein